MYVAAMTRLVLAISIIAVFHLGPPVFAVQNGGSNAQPRIVTQQGNSVQTQQQYSVRTAGAPQDIAIRIQLQAILDVQAQYGQFPGNNPLLADIQAMIAGGISQAKTGVRITNYGPGKLMIANSDGSVGELERGRSTMVEVGKAQIGLYCDNQFATIRLQHDRNGPCQFWDEDDRVHTEIASGFDFDGNPQFHEFTLTPGRRLPPRAIVVLSLYLFSRCGFSVPIRSVPCDVGHARHSRLRRNSVAPCHPTRGVHSIVRSRTVTCSVVIVPIVHAVPGSIATTALRRPISILQALTKGLRGRP